MNARDVMSKPVVTVHPDVPTREIARLLLDKHISAVPVVNDDGAAVGIVSEGDLIRPERAALAARRQSWLEILAEGEPIARELVAWLHSQHHTARAVMSAPAITVGEDTELGEVARVLVNHRDQARAGGPRWSRHRHRRPRRSVARPGREQGRPVTPLAAALSPLYFPPPPAGRDATGVGGTHDPRI